MGDVVNLRRARKARERIMDAVTAEHNRARFGRSKAERAASADETVRRDATLDAHRIEPPQGRRDEQGGD